MRTGQIRVGIAGLGHIGETHARALAHLRKTGLAVEVAAFSGGSRSRVAESGWPAARQMRVEDLVTAVGVDIVAVCTPSATHSEIALAALREGRHVVVEKPMALTHSDALRVVEVASERGLWVSPIVQRRFEEMHTYVKSLLDGHQLGRVVLGEAVVHWHRDDEYYASADWRRERGEGGGSLMNQGLHSLDLLCWLLGGATSVTGQVGTLGHEELQVEDTCVGTIRFRSGALGTIVTTTATPPGEPAEASVWTTTGSFRLSQAGVMHWGFAGIPEPPPPSAAVTGASDPSAIGMTGHVQQWQDVLTAYMEGRPPTIGAVDGLATTSVLAGIYQSAQEGRTVDVASL